MNGRGAAADRGGQRAQGGQGDRGAGDVKHLAHEVRNALNGVSVNLEVARARAARGSDLAQITPFLETAAKQLDVAAALHKRFADLAAQLASQLAAQVATRPAEITDRAGHP